MFTWLYKLGVVKAIRKYVPKALRYALVSVSVLVSGYLGQEAGAAFNEAIEPLVQVGTIAVAVLAAFVLEHKEEKKNAPEAPKPVVNGAG